jgi:hypothetical protein
MKLTAIISLLALLVLGSAGAAFAQGQEQKQKPTRPNLPPPPKMTFGPPPEKCPCNIIGTWKAQISTDESRLYSFDTDGVVKVLAVSGTAQPREIATAKYEFVEPELPDATKPDAPKDAPKQVSFTATGNSKIFGRAKATMNIVSYDDSSITCEIPGIAGTTRWTRVDPNRYFVVFAARNEEISEKVDTAFPMLIKLAGGVSKVDAAGIYPVGNKATFGAVPLEVYKDYLREARGDSEVILRLEITSGQYERALKHVQEWQRRAREDALVYREPYSQLALNNVLLVRSVSETLNLCQNDFDLYKLDYVHPTDWITNEVAPELIPFVFFKELRRRNEARHIDYKKFQELVPMSNLANR